MMARSSSDHPFAIKCFSQALKAETLGDISGEVRGRINFLARAASASLCGFQAVSPLITSLPVVSRVRVRVRVTVRVG